MICPACAWDGGWEDLEEVSVDLDASDCVTGGALGVTPAFVTRKNFLCPKCKRPLKTVRYVMGMEQKRDDL
jgi:hypothetical protein